MKPKPETEPPAVVPVVSEDVVLDKRAVRTGSVRVHKRVQNHTEHVEMPLTRESVDVKRVAINKVVPYAPQMRTEGDTTIIPVVEEEIVVTKRLVLKEEIHLIRRRTVEKAAKEIVVGREEAEVERVDAEGRRVEEHVEKPLFRETEGFLSRPSTHRRS